jgi:hypothetical protein
MAEGSEVERTSALVMALYHSEDQIEAGRMSLQMLKQRRVEQRHWELLWAPWEGRIQYHGDVDFSDALAELGSAS